MRSRGAGKKSEKCEFPGDGEWFRVQMGDARLGIGMGGRWACVVATAFCSLPPR